jgi:hypothetical protein
LDRLLTGLRLLGLLAPIQNVLQTVLLRRTREHKIDGQPIVSLPPCKIVQKEIEFSPMERQFYDTLFSTPHTATYDTRGTQSTCARANAVPSNNTENAQSVFNDYLENGTVLNHYVHILELLLRYVRRAPPPPIAVKS